MNIEIPNNIIEKIKSAELDPNSELTQLGDDIWFTDLPVAEHTDGTEDGKDTTFLVLVNDADYQFVYKHQVIDIPVGSVVRFDARYKHSTISNKPGRLGLIIWDNPMIIPTEDIVNDFKYRLNEEA